MRSTHELLHTRPSNALSGLEKEDKLALLRSRNISVNARSVDADTRGIYAKAAEQLGFTPFEFRTVFVAIATHLLEQNIQLPEGKKQKKQRGQIVDTLLSGARIGTDSDCKTVILFNQADADKPESSPDPVEVETLANHLFDDQAILGRVVGFIKAALEQQIGLLVLQQCSSNTSGNGVRISAETDIRSANQGTNFVDHAITSQNPGVINFGLLRETVRQTQYEQRREQLQSAIESGEIRLLPRFELNNWPVDHLMQSMRSQVSEATGNFIRNEGFLCDPQDLKYQVLFRLTTFLVADVFEGGEQLQDYLKAMGAYEHWGNILQVDAGVVTPFRLNQGLLNSIIEEQAKIIADRISRSPLPIRDILTPTGIFAEPGWVIAKRNGDIYAVLEEGSAHSSMVPLELREVDTEYAKQLHGDLHYIHTPRVDLAFGLFVQGEDIPFSVLALDKIDRPYKQNVLLAQGYDPRRCYDLTRLYSKPGTPGNTSSSIFGLTFRYLREQYPETQAVVSAFMPSYATGVSMTSGGFNNPIMIKTLRHTFAPTITSDGSVGYEHLTRRRHSEAGDELITNQFPLLPTIELMTKLREPRFEPLPGIQENMVEVLY